jgi:hypothetical protein
MTNGGHKVEESVLAPAHFIFAPVSYSKKTISFAEEQNFDQFSVAVKETQPTMRHL